MYDDEVRSAALGRIARGESLNSISKSIGVSRAALRDWRDNPERSGARPADCPRCDPAVAGLPRAEYAHLLGLYLGDGCLSALKKGVYSLRIACDNRYPRLIDEVAAAIEAVYPTRRTYRVAAVGCTQVMSYWKHWPCLFPQHGKGRKHNRRIVLAEWQQRIVDRHPGQFLRGLFNSDGCRITNWTTRKVGGQTKRYEYPRYMFSNESADIIRLCTESLNRLAIAWRLPRPNMLSVARKEAVAELDLHVGPKS
jgi:hypothetical protein